MERIASFVKRGVARENFDFKGNEIFVPHYAWRFQSADISRDFFNAFASFPRKFGLCIVILKINFDSHFEKNMAKEFSTSQEKFQN